MVYLIFALQYLRAGLTVPIYFERIEQEEDTLSAKALDQKSKKIVIIIVAI